MDNRQQAILKTLLYADLFDYPLTKTEIFKFLISEENIKKEELFTALGNKNLPVENAGDFFYLAGRRNLLIKRKRREKISAQKLELAKKIIGKISFISSIKLIGISGALSMRNSDEDDDIDLFVISDRNLVWTTRLLLVILLTIFGVYRNRNSRNHSNKICLNMIVDESHIVFKSPNRDLYTAHEIAQLLPIFNKGNIYERFIGENAWVKNYLPNFSNDPSNNFYKNSIFDKLTVCIFRVLQLEKVAKFLQLSYMKKHKTKEITKDGFLKFHPYDYKTYILRDYKKALTKYGL